MKKRENENERASQRETGKRRETGTRFCGYYVFPVPFILYPSSFCSLMARMMWRDVEDGGGKSRMLVRFSLLLFSPFTISPFAAAIIKGIHFRGNMYHHSMYDIRCLFLSSSSSFFSLFSFWTFVVFGYCICCCPLSLSLPVIIGYLILSDQSDGRDVLTQSHSFSRLSRLAILLSSIRNHSPCASLVT